MSDAAALEARGLVKGYRSEGLYVPVLRGVDLRVERGEMLAVVGESGAGKSTLLHVLGTLDVPERGEVLFEGRDAFRADEEERSRMRNREIGFVFQFHHLLPEFTALENLMMPLLIRRTPAEEARRRAAAIAEALGLAERVRHRPAQLSGGEQQRVAVGRALVGDPRLLLADEPTGNLDRRNADELLGLLRRLQRERALTAVLVTHNERVAAVCDRVLYMEDGRLAPAEARPQGGGERSF